MKKKIFISRTFFEKEIREKLKDFDLHFWQKETAPTSEEFIEQAQGAFGILTMLSDPIDKVIIEALTPDLKIISNYAVGFNNIDIDTARSVGAVVTNTPDVLTDAAAELVVGMMIGLGRHFESCQQVMRAGEFQGWEPAGYLGRQIAGTKVGIVGMGRIGQEVARRLSSFKCELFYNNRSRKPEMEKELKLTSYQLDELMEKSDYVILSLGLSDETYHLIDKRRLALMKSDAFLINIGRGALVDEQELIVALQQKRIGGAALDVYEQEPFLPEALRALENVVLLPHIGSATTRTRLDMLNLALENIIQVAAGKTALTSVI